MTARSLAALLATALALAAAGCGGSGEDEPAPTKAQYVKAVDALCSKKRADMRPKIDAILAEGDPGAPERSLLDVGMPALESLVEEIRELTVPEGEEERVEAMLEEIETGVTATVENPNVAAEDGNPFNSARAAAARYGFKSCWPI